MKIGIIGAGISGISSGRMLQDSGLEATIFERKDMPGGLISCERINGNLFHKVGGHVFNSKNEKVLEWFWRHFDKENEFIATRRNAKVFLSGKFLGYPIENYIYSLDPVLIQKIIVELLDLNKQPYKDPLSYHDFEAFLQDNFGRTLYDIYFKPYNHKIWNVDLSEVPMHWLEGKLPMPNYREIILNNILQKEESEMVHSNFYYAKTGGSQFIIDRLSEGLNIIKSEKIEKIEQVDKRWKIKNEYFDHIIYTGDIRELHSIIKTSDDQVSKLACQQIALRSNGTSNVLCYTDPSDLSWLYLPDPELSCHRIIYTGNFSPSNNAGKRSTCVVEFSGKVERDVIVANLKQLPGNLDPIAFNYEPNSYVIQDIDTRFNVNQLKTLLRLHNFHLLGRFAEWEYYNMDKCMEAAFEVTNAIFGK